MAASTARRAASRVRAPKTAALNDDDPPEEPKTKRITSKPVAPVAKLTAKAKPPATRTRARPSALVQRVYNTIDGELTKLEKQKGLTSQDRERASRALSQMVNALEKAVEMCGAAAHTAAALYFCT